MLIIGIDPGLRGASVAIGFKSGRYIDGFDCPIVSVGKRDEFMPRTMAQHLKRQAGLLNSEAHVFLELAGVRPKQSAQSGLKTGRGMGIWEGILAALGIPHTIVAPGKWMAKMVSGSRSEKKQRAMLAAEKMFPEMNLFGPLGGARHGRADAALIAAWGRRHLRGEW
jgi:crossover junction endodeoxyribonuclease RuvC